MWPLPAEVEAYTNIPLTAGKTAYGVDVAELLKRAQARCESYCFRKFDSATVTEKHDNARVILIRRPPVTAITSVTVNGRVLEENAGFFLTSDLGLIRLSVEPAHEISQLTAFKRKPNAIEIVYTGGFTTLPGDIKAAVLELACHKLMQIDEQFREMKGAENVKIGSLTVAFGQADELAILARLNVYRR